MSIQPNLPGAAHVSHSNLGSEFEGYLSAAHSEYKMRGLASVEKNPVEWQYSGSEAKFRETLGMNATVIAKVNNGRFIQPRQSDVDYSGVIRGGRAVMFDAKQTREKSLPFANIKSHQIENLQQKAALGALAGLMIYFSSLDKVYFLPADVVARLFLEMKRGGRKSISLELCETEGFSVIKRGNQVDWYKSLIK